LGHRGITRARVDDASGATAKQFTRCPGPIPRTAIHAAIRSNPAAGLSRSRNPADAPRSALARTRAQPVAAGADPRTGIAGAESTRPARDATAAGPARLIRPRIFQREDKRRRIPPLASAFTSRRLRYLAGDFGSNRKDSFMAGSSGDVPQGGNRNNNPGNFANNREKASRAGQIGGSRQGAASNPGNFANNRDRAREAGHLGGVHQGKGNNPANFANDPAKAREAGHIGGTHQGRQNNPANFANDRSKASEAGRLGGQQRGGSRVGGSEGGQTAEA
jgi:uncharacterized protein